MTEEEGLEGLLEYSSLYRSFCGQYSEEVHWIRNQVGLDKILGLNDYRGLWENFSVEGMDGLRRFRRLMSMRLAWQEWLGKGSLRERLGSQSELAQFCIEAVYEDVRQVCDRQMGVPCIKDSVKRARFCVLGLGKLGGGELNFCSDVDLIYMYQGQGYCVKGERETGTTNQEYFTQLCRRMTQELEKRTQEGFLYNVDLRLRPDGVNGLVVRSLTAMENYYGKMGQTWERLAYIKARAVVGDKDLGEELLEGMSSFIYPRTVLPTMVDEIGALKYRIESETVDQGDLNWDLKSGIGGIREIEFIAQGLQMMYGNRIEELRSVSVYEALEGLANKGFIEEKSVEGLVEAYEFYRLGENRLQMKQETSVSVVDYKDEEEFDRYCRSLGYKSKDAYEKVLRQHQEQVHEVFEHLYPGVSPQVLLEEWVKFFATAVESKAVSERMDLWFKRGDRQAAVVELRTFLLGNNFGVVSRSVVEDFVKLGVQLDEVMVMLARPVEGISRLGEFASAYGSRKHFIKVFLANQSLMKALALAFDRSDFIYKLLKKHPEYLDEIVLELPCAKKGHEEYARALDEILSQNGFEEELAIFAKIEELKIMLGRTLHKKSIHDVELELTLLVDRIVQGVLKKLDPEGELGVVALGKYGGCELCPGSDLDLVFLMEGLDDKRERVLEVIESFLGILGQKVQEWSMYEVDMRLRPYGKNGPKVISIQEYDEYLRKKGQLWEKQILTRGRWIYGKDSMRDGFRQVVNDHLYSKGIDVVEIDEIDTMLERIKSEKVQEGVVAFKHGLGGTQSVEFCLQSVQMRLGRAYPELRRQNVPELLKCLKKLDLFELEVIEGLGQGYEFLRKIEFHLRRNCCKSIDVVETDPSNLKILSHWLKFDDVESFFERIKEVMSQNDKARRVIISQLKKTDI